MKICIPIRLIDEIQQHGILAYPEEGAGMLLGYVNEESRSVEIIFPLKNSRENSARHNRYLITPGDMQLAEREAEEKGLEVIGVFHSHPDHPESPSDFDREWALPWFSYIITSVYEGEVMKSRSWRLTDDRKEFKEEKIVIK